jgi:hypothetical protein
MGCTKGSTVDEMSADTGTAGGGLVLRVVEGAVATHRPEHSCKASSDGNRGDEGAASLRYASCPQAQRLIGMLARATQDGPSRLHEHGARVRVAFHR